MAIRCPWSARTLHGHHLRDARNWRRRTRGRTWHLDNVSTRNGRRVYVWVCKVPGRKAWHYVALDGTKASMALLHLLTEAQAGHEQAITEAITAPHEVQEIPGSPIMMV